MDKRIRFHFAKRDRAIFLPHVELPAVFARAARRAKIPLLYSEGFHPRPRVSLGPPLPMGVVALSEPGDLRVREWNSAMGTMLREECPPGIDLLDAVPSEEKDLGKICSAGSYLLRERTPGVLERIREYLREEEHREECRMLDFQENSDELTFILDERRTGLGSLVKKCIAQELCAGWGDLFLLREAVGFIEEGCFCRV